VSNGWDNVKDLNDAKMLHFVTGLSRVILRADGNYFHSFSEQADDGENGRDLVDLVAKITPTDLLRTSSSSSTSTGAARRGRGRRRLRQWYGFSGIVRQDFALTSSEKNWFVALRGSTSTTPTAPGRSLRLGEDVALYELTLTLGFKPMENLLLRTEVATTGRQERLYHRSGDAGAADENHQTTWPSRRLSSTRRARLFFQARPGAQGWVSWSPSCAVAEP